MTNIGKDPVAQICEEITNGDLAATAANQEAIDAENERHRLWRIAVLGQHVAEMGYKVDE